MCRQLDLWSMPELHRQDARNDLHLGCLPRMRQLLHCRTERSFFALWHLMMLVGTDLLNAQKHRRAAVPLLQAFSRLWSLLHVDHNPTMLIF